MQACIRYFIQNSRTELRLACLCLTKLFYKNVNLVYEPCLIQVINLTSQLSNFERVRESLRKNLGDEEAKTLIARAVFLFSAGGNDYSYIFSTNSTILRTHSHREFVGMVLGNITAAIKVSF